VVSEPASQARMLMTRTRSARGQPGPTGHGSPSSVSSDWCRAHAGPVRPAAASWSSSYWCSPRWRRSQLWSGSWRDRGVSSPGAVTGRMRATRGAVGARREPVLPAGLSARIFSGFPQGPGSAATCRLHVALIASDSRRWLSSSLAFVASTVAVVRRGHSCVTIDCVPTPASAPVLAETACQRPSYMKAVSDPAPWAWMRSRSRRLRTGRSGPGPALFVGSRSRLAMACQVLSSPRRAAYARACAARCGVLEAGALHAGALLAGGAGCSLQFNVSGPVAPARWTCSPCWQPSLTGHDPPSPVSSASRRVHAGLCCPPRNPCSPTRSPGALHAGALHAGGAPAAVLELASRARLLSLRTSSSCWQPGLAPQVTGRLASSSPRRTVC
jgi:hypothetical protein